MSIASRLFRVLRARLTALSAAPDGGPFRGQATRGAAGAPAIDRELAALYANLEVPYGSDLATVRAAWKQLAKTYHPDLHGADPERQRTATELLKGLNRAFEELRRRLESSATTHHQGGRN